MTHADDPHGGQPPLPFEAAERYAQATLALGQAPPPAGSIERLGLAYGPLPQHRLDLYAPAGARGAPVLVFWHGGGWTNGWRHWVRLMAPAVLARGLLLLAPSYRLAHQARLPAACDDATLALAWARQQVAGHGGAAHRLVLAGHSAGGHLAALTALRDAPAQQGAAPPLRACLPVSAILDLHHPAPPPGSLEERLYTCVLDDPDDDARLSPIHWTRGNPLPFALAVGQHDSERVRRSNRRMAALLQAQAAPCRLDSWAGCDHFATHLALADAGHTWYDTLDSLTR